VWVTDLTALLKVSPAGFTSVALNVTSISLHVSGSVDVVAVLSETTLVPLVTTQANVRPVTFNYAEFNVLPAVVQYKALVPFAKITEPNPPVVER